MGARPVMPYYEHAGIAIYHADCRDVLDQLAPAHMVFADPPYGVGISYGASYADEPGVEYDALLRWLIPFVTTAPVGLVTPGMRHFWSWPAARWILAWNKPNSMRRSSLGGFNMWEPVLLYGKVAKPIAQDAIALPFHHDDDTGNHPCPKPLRLLAWLIRITTEPGQLVIDPMMGSGTTLRAAKDLGRKAIGIEIEERYCEVAAKRMAQEVLF